MLPNYVRCRVQNSEVESVTRYELSDPVLPTP